MDTLILILSVIGIVSWLAYMPYAVLTLYSLKNIPSYEKDFDEKEARKMRRDKFIVFRFVTRGRTERLINKGIMSITSSCKRLRFSKYRIEVVTDEAGDEFESIASKIVVPADYRTKNGTKYKARALNYAIENTHASANTWILHLDDESRITPQALCAVLHYLRHNPKVAAEGAINYPYEFGKNYITSLLEGERSFSCLFCVFQLEIDPIWLHGSNLLVRSDIEKQIGWDFGADSIAEDARFGYEVVRRFGSKAFGWHGGTMLEQPTFTIRDTIRQRQRWFLGAINNFRYMPSKAHKLLGAYFLAAWMLGFFASFFGLPALFGILYIPIVMKPILVFCLLAWMLNYQVGLYLNIRHLRLPISERALYHISAIVFLPVLGVVSTFPAVYSLFRKPTTFEVVQKDLHTELAAQH